MWLLSTWNVTSKPEDMNFLYYLTLVNNKQPQMASKYQIGKHSFRRKRC